MNYFKERVPKEPILTIRFKDIDSVLEWLSKNAEPGTTAKLALNAALNRDDDGIFTLNKSFIEKDIAQREFEETFDYEACYKKYYEKSKD